MKDRIEKLVTVVSSRAQQVRDRPLLSVSMVDHTNVHGVKQHRIYGIGAPDGDNKTALLYVDVDAVSSHQFCLSSHSGETVETDQAPDLPSSAEREHARASPPVAKVSAPSPFVLTSSPTVKESPKSSKHQADSQSILPLSGTSSTESRTALGNRTVTGKGRKKKSGLVRRAVPIPTPSSETILSDGREAKSKACEEILQHTPQRHWRCALSQEQLTALTWDESQKRNTESLSRAEELRRERMRSLGAGIREAEMISLSEVHSPSSASSSQKSQGEGEPTQVHQFLIPAHSTLYRVSLPASRGSRIQQAAVGEKKEDLESAASEPLSKELEEDSPPTHFLPTAEKIPADFQPFKPAAVDLCACERELNLDTESMVFGKAERFENGTKEETLPQTASEEKPDRARVDGKLSPDGKWVSYHCDGELWLGSTQDECVAVPLTKSEGDRTSGEAEFIMQEEFDRYSGQFWSPRIRVEKIEGKVPCIRCHYQILYTELDVSSVQPFQAPSSSYFVEGKGKVDDFRYPLVGERNCKVRLILLSFSIDVQAETFQPLSKNLIQGWQRSIIPCPFIWAEYIPRLGFLPCGESIWALYTDRRQRRACLVTADICFAHQWPSYQAHSNIGFFGGRTVEEILTEQEVRPSTLPIGFESVAYFMDDDWLEFDDGPIPLSPNLPSPYVWDTGASTATLKRKMDRINQGCVRPALLHQKLFLVMSERTGSRQLFVVFPNRNSSSLQTQNGLQLSALRNGITSLEDCRIDHKRKLLYFTACMPTPLYAHLCVLSFEEHWRYLCSLEDAEEKIKDTEKLSSSPLALDLSLPPPAVERRLTMPGYSHQVWVFPKASLVLGHASNSSTPPICVVYALVFFPHEHWPRLHPLMRASLQHHGGTIPHKVITPTHFRFPSTDGLASLYGVYFRNPEIPATKILPTALFVYGGPGVQLVVDHWSLSISHLRVQELVQLGFQVVMIDGRGSAQRDRFFTRALRAGLGQVEIDDQVAGLKVLASQGLLRLGEVAVYGSSYGGYLSLACLAHRPMVFLGAAAFAPVTDWLAYDTAYTERYLGFPKELVPLKNEVNLRDANEQVRAGFGDYAASGLLKYAEKFPDTTGRLLLGHGLIDENVHFSHTSALIEALTRAYKPYELFVLPQDRHGVRSWSSHLYREFRFLQWIIHLFRSQGIPLDEST